MPTEKREGHAKPTNPRPALKRSSQIRESRPGTACQRFGTHLAMRRVRPSDIKPPQGNVWKKTSTIFICCPWRVVTHEYMGM